MEETKVDPSFQKGFNNGYYMSEHEPDLARQISQIENATAHLDGFKAGRIEYFKEQIKDFDKSWVQEFSVNEQDITQNKDKDVGLEPEP